MTTTAENNKQNIRRLYENIFKKKWNGKLTFLRYKNKVIDAIENSDRTLGGILTQYKIICAMLRDSNNKLYEFYKNKMNEFIPKVTEQNKLNQAKQYEEYLEDINWKIIINDIANKVYKNGTAKEKLLFLIYTKHPPRRTQLAQYLKLGKDAGDKYNWLDIDNNCIVLNVWKNHKYSGKDIIYYDPNDIKMMKELIDELEIKNGDLIFPKKNGDIMKQFYLIRNLFHKYTFFHLSTRALRHLYITDYLSNNRSIADIETMAKKMGNSSGVFREYNRI